MNETLPLEARIWSAADCAGYFQHTPQHFLRETRFSAGFPPPLAMSDGKRPRWSAKAVVDWALK